MQWQNLTGISKSGTNIIGGTNFGTTGNIVGASTGLTSVGQGLTIGLVNGTTTLLNGTTILNLGMPAHVLDPTPTPTSCPHPT